MKQLKAVRCQERGWVVLTAIWVMFLMIGVGIALLSIVDEQSAQSRVERVRESSFNLTEGALYTESVTLQNNWPTMAPLATTGSGATCDPASTTPPKGCAYGRFTAANAANSFGSPCVYSGSLTGPTSQCPTLAAVTNAFNDVDAATGATWTVHVRDNIGRNQANAIDSTVSSTTYDRPTVDTAACKDANNANVICTWDNNGDRRLWVRAEGVVRGKKRMMVALLQLERIPIPFPTNVITSQGLEVTNNGNDMVNGSGSQVALRCGFSDTTTAGSIAKNTSTVAVNAPASGKLEAGIGIKIDVGSNAEQRTINSVSGSGPFNVTLNQKVQNDHNSGVAFVMSPNNDSDNTCNRWGTGQVSADQFQTGNNWPAAMDDATYNSVLADPTTKHYTTCPVNGTAAAWSGTVVVDSGGTGNPTSNATATCNMKNIVPNGPVGSGNPTTCTTYGMVIVNSGTLRIDGTVFCGIVYMRNKGTAISGPVFATDNNAQVIGSVAVDGPGVAVVGQGCGSCGGAVIYDPNARRQLGVSGTAGLVQNTWRELVPGQ